jgi:hypothetical protein
VVNINGLQVEVADLVLIVDMVVLAVDLERQVLLDGLVAVMVQFILDHIQIIMDWEHLAFTLLVAAVVGVVMILVVQLILVVPVVPVSLWSVIKSPR